MPEPTHIPWSYQGKRPDQVAASLVTAAYCLIGAIFVLAVVGLRAWVMSGRGAP